ncbi:copper resistance protein CopC, partial [Shigella flexneri]|nr:copper resistance protein CopC [Shigella flexneri]
SFRFMPGTYTVDWHVVSVDGHKTKGHASQRCRFRA